MRKVLIRADGLVVNVIEWNPDGKWVIPENHILMDLPDASPGDVWDGRKLIKQTKEVDQDRINYEAANTDKERLDVIAQKLGLLLPLK